MSDSKRRDTGMKDQNGKSIFEGDTVIYCWGMYRGGNFYRAHKVTLYQKKNKTAWHLGDNYNSWSGNHTQVVDAAHYPPLETDFFFDEQGNPHELTWQIKMGWTDEQYAAYQAEQDALPSFFDLLMGRTD